MNWFPMMVQPKLFFIEVLIMVKMPVFGKINKAGNTINWSRYSGYGFGSGKQYFIKYGREVPIQLVDVVAVSTVALPQVISASAVNETTSSLSFAERFLVMVVNRYFYSCPHHWSLKI